MIAEAIVGQRRRRARLLPADQPVGARGDLASPPLRAVRLRADDRRAATRRPTARRRTRGSPGRRPGTSSRSPSGSSASGPSTTGCGSTRAPGDVDRRSGRPPVPRARPTRSTCDRTGRPRVRRTGGQPATAGRGAYASTAGPSTGTVVPLAPAGTPASGRGPGSRDAVGRPRERAGPGRLPRATRPPPRATPRSGWRCSRAAGPRIVGLGLTDRPNLLAETPDLGWETPYGRYELVGGHRLWFAPEDPERVAVPDSRRARRRARAERRSGSSGPSNPDTGLRAHRSRSGSTPAEPALSASATSSGTAARSRSRSPRGRSPSCRSAGRSCCRSGPPSRATASRPNRNLVLWPYTSWTTPGSMSATAS